MVQQWTFATQNLCDSVVELGTVGQALFYKICKVTPRDHFKIVAAP